MTVRSVSLRQNPAYRLGGSLLLLSAALALAACAPRVPQQTLPERQPDARGNVPTEIKTSWLSRRSNLAFDLDVSQRAVVVVRLDSTTTQDSSRIDLRASVRHTDAGWAGLLQRAVASSGDAVTSPVAVRAVRGPDGSQVQVRVVGTPTNACDRSVVVAAALLSDVLFSLPDTVRVGTVWADSARYRICRAGTSYDVESVRRYRIGGVADRTTPDSALLVTVDRRASVRLSGLAVRGPDTTRAEGEGSSTATFEVDALRGAVVRGEGRSQLSLRVFSGSRIQHATQSAQLTVSVPASRP